MIIDRHQCCAHHCPSLSSNKGKSQLCQIIVLRGFLGCKFEFNWMQQMPINSLHPLLKCCVLSSWIQSNAFDGHTTSLHEMKKFVSPFDHSDLGLREVTPLLSGTFINNDLPILLVDLEFRPIQIQINSLARMQSFLHLALLSKILLPSLGLCTILAR